MKARRGLLWALLVFVSATSARADGGPGAESLLERKFERKAVRIFGDPEWVNLKIVGSAADVKETTLSGFAAGVGFSYGLSRKIAFIGKVRQAFSKEHLTSMFSELGVGASYAITGSFLRDNESVYLGGSLVSSTRDHTTGGFRTSIIANQYFLNASNTVVGLVGLGVLLAWEAPSEAEWTWHLGVRQDIAGNGKMVITPTQVYLGIDYWL